MGPKQLEIHFFRIHIFAIVYRKTQRVQPPNFNNLCGHGTNFPKSCKSTKIRQNLTGIGHIYLNKWHWYSPQRAIDVDFSLFGYAKAPQQSIFDINDLAKITNSAYQNPLCLRSLHILTTRIWNTGNNCYFVVELVTLGWSQNETLLDKGGRGCFVSVLWATRVVPIPEVVVGQGGWGPMRQVLSVNGGGVGVWVSGVTGVLVLNGIMSGDESAQRATLDAI